jgi:hypothetical protein
VTKLFSESFPTIDVAVSMSRRLVDEHNFSHFEGKADELWEALILAERAHDDALQIATVTPEMNKNEMRLAKALQRALAAIEECETGWAFYDPDLDHSYTNPDSMTDLKGMLKRAIVALEADPLDVRQIVDSDTGKRRRSHRNLPGIKSDGLAALVASLENFWRVSNAPGSFSESTTDAADKGDGLNRISNPALRVVFEAAKNIDHRYTLKNCVNAIRVHRDNVIALRKKNLNS